MASSGITLANSFLCSSGTSAVSLKISPFSIPVQLFSARKHGIRINAAVQKWDPAKVVPQADRVLIRLEELPQKSAGGVLLPKSAVKFERYVMVISNTRCLKILSVGADVSGVETGEKVLFSDISAYEVDLGIEEKHCFCKSSDLLAVVE